MEYMTLNKFIKLIFKRWKILLYFVLFFIVISILFGLFAYNPNYTSEAKLLLKQDKPNTFVTELNAENEVTSLGGNKNPILTQIEVLSSIDLISRVSENLIKEPGYEGIPPLKLAGVIKSRIKFENPSGTDIIVIQANWNNPEDAQKIASLLLDSYYKYNDSLRKKSVNNTKKYIETQLKNTNDDLEKVRAEIEKYRKDNSSIDVSLEAESMINQISRMENNISDVDVNIASTNKKVKDLAENLGIGLKQALDSVALGQSSSLQKLNQTLMENEQEVAALKVKYPETTPRIQTLKSAIEEIKKQIEKETIFLIGKKEVKENKSLISDSVRSNMVQDYVQNTVELNALLAEKSALQRSLNKLRNNQKLIPEVQKTIQALLEKEKNLELIAETLNAKLVEANIKESAIINNIDIIQSPLLPTAVSFPSFIHILAIFVLVGTLMGVVTILGLYYVEDICEGSDDLEEIIKAPVLGIIPWLTSTAYNNFLTDYNPHSVVAIIYQKIATAIKVKCYKKNINSIALISAELEKRRSIVAASLANTLAKTNDKIILIDTDFRDSSLTREFQIDFSSFPDVTDLLIELSKVRRQEEPVNFNEVISKYIIQIPQQKNLYFIPNNKKVDNPYEILNNPEFSLLMQKLKENFDLVILDTPPVLAVSDSIITAQHVDAMLVLCGIKTSRSNLRKLAKICRDNYVEILGAIARDSLTELEVPENMYIKQLSGSDVY